MKLPALAIALLATHALHAAGAAPITGEKHVIMQLTSIFENSTTELRYGYCENIHDQRGYTFGFAGFTSGTYDGTELLKEYIRLKPGDNPLAKYLPAFEAIDKGKHDSEGRNPDTRGLDGFPDAVKTCAPDPLFQQAQHAIADKLYWTPSQKEAARLGAKHAITRGQLYDAFINHGADGALKLIKTATQTSGGTPKDGIDEKKWLAAFLDARLAVLKADKTWAESIDRVRVYQKLLATGNVDLKLPIPVTCYGDSFTIK